MIANRSKAFTTSPLWRAIRRRTWIYTGVLGLRLVKRTVNFDDPGTYHFYYGNQTGTPGTILTFFPWPMAEPERERIEAVLPPVEVRPVLESVGGAV